MVVSPIKNIHTPNDLWLTYLASMRQPNGLRSRTSPAGCGAGAGVDSAWGQKKLEARKCLRGRSGE